MLQLTADDSEVLQYMEATRLRIFAGIREGMVEGIQGLAYTAVDLASGELARPRSGAFIGALLGSQKVRETESFISGSVSGKVGKKPLGLWLDEGTIVPAVQGPAAKFYQFTPASGDSIWTHGHAAFAVEPHPVMSTAIERYAPTLLDIIAAKVAEATD